MLKIKNLIYLLLLIPLSGCEKLIISDNNSDLNEADFRAAWQRVKYTYPYIDKKGVDWDSIYTLYEPLAEKAKGDEIYLVLVNMLAELKDGHISVLTERGLPIQTYNSPRKLKDINSFSQEVTRNYFGEKLKTGLAKSAEYGILKDNIGYIYLSSMSICDDGNLMNEFDNILNYFSSTKALIMDLRHNEGGWSFCFISRFIEQKVEVYEYYQNKRVEDFINPAGFHYNKKLVVLINGCSISASEDFAHIMKRLPGVTVIGDTTAGMHNNIDDPYILPSGKRITIPYCYPSFEGESFENIGVAPDIRVEQTENDIKNGIDKQLEYAIAFLNEN